MLTLVCGSGATGVEVQNSLTVLPFTGVTVDVSGNPSFGLTHQTYNVSWSSA